MPTGRRGYSRSPHRNDLPYDDLPEEDSRHREDMRRERHGYYADRCRDYQRRRGNSRDDYLEREGYYSQRLDHSRDTSPGRYDDPHSRHHRRRGSGSYERHGRPRSRKRSRSYSRSPPRHPGSPSDTVILEGLPHDISVNEVSGLDVSMVFHLVARHLSPRGRAAIPLFLASFTSTWILSLYGAFD